MKKLMYIFGAIIIIALYIKFMNNYNNKLFDRYNGRIQENSKDRIIVVRGN